MKDIEMTTVDSADRGEATSVLIPSRVDFEHWEDFEKFAKRWKSTTYSSTPSLSSCRWYQFRHTTAADRLSKIRRREPTTIFDSTDGKPSEFNKILESSHSDGSFKFVSFVLQHFKVWNDEVFLEQHGLRAIEKFGSLPNFQISSHQVENLFSYLMYDWFDPEPGQTYAMVLKSEQFDEVHEKSLFKVLFDIIDDHERYKKYRYVVLRLLYQFLFELDKDCKLKDKDCFLCIDDLIDLLLKVKDQELKVYGLKIVTVFWLASCTDDAELLVFKEAMIDFLNDDQIDYNDSLVYKNDSERRQTEDLIRLTKETSDFLNLCFQLKSSDNSLLKFQDAFEKYLKISEEYYGDYMHIGMTHKIQLLSFLAGKESFHSTVNFIFQKFPYIGVNATILTSFEILRGFTSFKVHKVKSSRLQEIEQQLAEDSSTKDSCGKFSNFGKLLSAMSPEDAQCDSELNCWVFGRPLSDEEQSQPDSMFERILKTVGTSSLIELIWIKFGLSTKEEILGLKNCHGKYLIEYVIDSKDDENLFFFLKPKLDASSFEVPKVNLKFQTRLFSSATGKSIFEHFIDICKRCRQKGKSIDILETPLRFRFYTIMFSLFEEMSQIRDIKEEVPIEKLLEWVKKPVEQNASNRNDFDNVKEDIDDLLANTVAYWTTADPNFVKYKEKILSDSQMKPFYDILFSIIEKVELEAFKSMFVENLMEVESVCTARYLKRDNEKIKTREHFVWIIILTAILNENRNIIEFILTTESIANLKLSFPSNMRQSKTTNFFAMKMLETDYKIGNEDLPPQWITARPFLKFLDEKLSYKKNNFVEVDCRFLLHSFTAKYQVRSEKDIDQKLMLWEDTNSLKYIYDDESLKDFITHPTIATYIDLKMYKFQSIYWWNFWLFAFLFALPFGGLVTSYFCGIDRCTVVALSICCAISLAALAAREYFQFHFIDETLKKYIRKGSNILEACLMTAAILTLVAILFDTSKESVVFIKLMSVTTMLLFTFDLLATLRNASMPFYFIMLKKVAITFVKFFVAFLVILIAFTISFWVFFGVETEKSNLTSTSTEKWVTNETESDESRDEVFNNFLSFPKAFMKIILMLSGEYSIEPHDLSTSELALFFIFVITTFILFNLILGLTIDDVEKLKDDARVITLRQNVRNIIGTSSFCFRLYKEHAFYAKPENKSTKKWLQRLLKVIEWFVKKQISSYYLLHKIDKFYVNVSTREITFDISRKQFKALTTNSRFLRWKEKLFNVFADQSFKMDEEAFDRCKKFLRISVPDYKKEITLENLVIVNNCRCGLNEN